MIDCIVPSLRSLFYHNHWIYILSFHANSFHDNDGCDGCTKSRDLCSYDGDYYTINNRIQQNGVQSPIITAARHTTTLTRWPDDPVICMVSLPMCHPSPFRRQHNCHLHSTNSPSTAPRFSNVHQQYVYLINIKSTIFILLCAREVPIRFIIVCFLFCFFCQNKVGKKDIYDDRDRTRISNK